MILKTEALIIKEQIVGESDKLLTLLTADEGVIKAFARRAKNLKDSKACATSLLSYSRLSIYKGRDKYIIDDASPIEVFFGLRNQITSLSLAQYFCELAVLLVPEEVESREYLRLVLNSISFLANEKKEPLLIKAITELRILSKSGYMPNLVACSECACYENEEWYFFPKTGEITCKNCLGKSCLGESCLGESVTSAILINQSVLTAMRHTIYSDFNKIYSFNLQRPALLSFCKASEEYILNTFGKMPMTLDFFKTINDEKF